MNTHRVPRVASVIFVVLAFLAFFSPAYAADTSTVQIYDPFTDALQLWSEIGVSVQALIRQVDVTFGQQHPLVVGSLQTPYASRSFRPASLSAPAALAVSKQSPTGSTVPAKQSNSKFPTATSDSQNPTTTPANLPKRVTIVAQTSPTTNSSANTAIQYALPAYVSEAELDTKLEGLASQLRSELYGTTGNTSSLPASGGVWNTIALTNNISQLSGVTITNSSLTASEIPDLSGTYLPLSGGTLTGTLNVSTINASSTIISGFSTTNATSTNFFSTNASTTNATSTTLFSTLANFGTAIATTFNASIANIVGLTATNATTTNLVATNATSTNTFATTASSTNLFAQTASVGALTVNSLALRAPLSVANGGTGWSSIVSGFLPFGNGGSALATSSSLFWDSINNRLGIGTTSPAAPIELFGTDSSTNLVTGGGIFEAITNADQTAGNFDSLSYREVNSAGAEVTGTRVSGVFNSHVAGAESADLVFLTRNAGTLSEKLRITGAGNVGIGTTTPWARLSVTGPDTSATSPAFVAADSNNKALFSIFDNGQTTITGNLSVNGTASTSLFSSYGPAYFGGTSTSSFATDGTLTLAKTFAANGTTGTSTIASGQGFAIGTSQFVLQQGSGNVGIGTAAPSAALSVSGSQTITGNIFGSGNPTIFGFNTNAGRTLYGGYSGSAVTGAYMQMMGQANNGGSTFTSNGGAEFTIDAAGNATQFNILSYNGTNYSNLFNVQSGGNIGIGTTSPWKMLSVAGDIIGTNITATGTLSVSGLSTLTGGFLSLASSTVTGNLTATGFLNTSGTTGGYKIDGNLVLQASSTNSSTLVGNGAGAKLFSNGNNDTAIGFQSLFSATTSSNNTAVGENALWSDTTGGGNSALGQAALFTNTTGVNNSAFGQGALFSNITGFNNAAFGYQALLNNTTGTFNTAVGASALLQATTTSGNTAVGYQSLQGNTSFGLTISATGDAALGYQSLENEVNGGLNTALGYQAIQNATSSGQNTAVGYEALQGSATVSNTGSNVAVGYASLLSNSSGNSNTGLGTWALRLNTSGTFNTAAGADALTANTTGGLNTSVGTFSLDNNFTGSNNTALGYAADGDNLSATNTVAIGYKSAFGNISLYNNQGGTVVGYQAGFNFQTGSDYNTLFGYSAGSNITTGAGNLIFGANVLAPSATASNQLNIGNVLYGTGIYSSSGNSPTQSSAPTANGRIGIGTTTPYSLLTLWGANTTAGSQIFNVTNSASTTNFSIDNAGFISAGASTLGTPSGVFTIDASSSTTTISNLSLGNLTFDNDAGIVNLSDIPVDANAALGVQEAQIINIGGNPLITASGISNGSGGVTSLNVGIGTSTTPYSTLQVWGPDSAASTSAFLVANNASTTEFAVLDNGNATLAGNLIQNSDQRLKTNIQSLDASSSLSLIEQLNPVTFNWVDPNKGSTPQLGFIAQQVLPFFPNLIATTSATALTPDGTLSLNYIGFIAPIISAIQSLDQELSDLSSVVAGFAQSFTSHQINTDQLCIKNSSGTPVCVTGNQLAAVLAQAGQNSSPPLSTGSSGASNASTPPIIQINGDNPAIIQEGATYNDLGATITGPQADLNLGIKTFLNGMLTSDIVVDTSAAATDTIDYVVTDSAGTTATSTREVIVEAAPQTEVASTTTQSATSTTP